MHRPAPLISHPSIFYLFIYFFCSCPRLYKESSSGPHQPEGVWRSVWCWCSHNTGADWRSCKCPSTFPGSVFNFLQALLGVVYSVTVECRAGGGRGQEAQGTAGKGEVPLQHGTANGYDLTLLVKYCWKCSGLTDRQKLTGLFRVCCRRGPLCPEMGRWKGHQKWSGPAGVFLKTFFRVCKLRLFDYFHCINQLTLLQVLQLLGKKTEADLEKKAKVTNGTLFKGILRHFWKMLLKSQLKPLSYWSKYPLPPTYICCHCHCSMLSSMNVALNMPDTPK